ncbi:MAG: hypothetical protein LC714_09145, partial [Actinobacteria bacterium]|nr:hypothetical protein [Actinomycetota bacterium]
ALDWFLGLNVGQKALAVLFGGLLVFSVAYLITSGVLWLLFANPEEPAPAEDGRREEASVLDEESAAPPGMDLQITRAEWVGNTVEVEGTWGGEISSVHCDLFEGDEEQRVTDWWNRSVPPTMSWSERTFTQLFVEAERRKVEEPVDASARYSVTCMGAFSNGWSTNSNAPVGGDPSG